MAEQMVERVAKALRADRYPDDPWETASELCREDFRGHARAAIEAMREPTLDMMIAGSDMTCTNANRTEVAASWRHMINVALKD